jgi:hypothetical protein
LLFARAAGRGAVQGSDSPGTMIFCQENNELSANPIMLYKYSCR